MWGRFARRLLPHPVFQVLAGNRNAAALQDPLRRAHHAVDLGGGALLGIYWKILPTGRGPAVYLSVHGHEVVRFDCFGRPDGHCHVRVLEWRRGGVRRLELPEPGRAEQVERALFEIASNAAWYIERHPVAVVRRVRLAPNVLRAAVAGVREPLGAYIVEVERQAREVPG